MKKTPTKKESGIQDIGKPIKSSSEKLVDLIRLIVPDSVLRAEDLNENLKLLASAYDSLTEDFLTQLYEAIKETLKNELGFCSDPRFENKTDCEANFTCSIPIYEDQEACELNGGTWDQNIWTQTPITQETIPIGDGVNFESLIPAIYETVDDNFSASLILITNLINDIIVLQNKTQYQSTDGKGWEVVTDIGGTNKILLDDSGGMFIETADQNGGLIIIKSKETVNVLFNGLVTEFYSEVFVIGKTLSINTVPTDLFHATNKNYVDGENNIQNIQINANKALTENNRDRLDSTGSLASGQLGITDPNQLIPEEETIINFIIIEDSQSSVLIFDSINNTIKVDENGTIDIEVNSYIRNEDNLSDGIYQVRIYKNNILFDSEEYTVSVADSPSDPSFDNSTFRRLAKTAPEDIFDIRLIATTGTQMFINNGKSIVEFTGNQIGNIPEVILDSNIESTTGITTELEPTTRDDLLKHQNDLLQIQNDLLQAQNDILATDNRTKNLDGNFLDTGSDINYLQASNEVRLRAGTATYFYVDKNSSQIRSTKQFDMGNNKITNTNDPIDVKDVANRQYVDFGLSTLINSMEISDDKKEQLKDIIKEGIRNE